jgi:TPP-dependent indolepyruvate ferredoxin oxidoreductase alpha subunit
MVVSDIISRALIDSAVSVVTYVPGYGGSAIFRAYSGMKGGPVFISYHEEVAYTVAHGAAVTGNRAACLFKTHGIMKAANSVSDSLLCGTNAGLVVIICKDHGGTHSDSIIEAKPFLEGIGIPNFFTSPATVYEDVHRAFEMSEETGLPFALLLDAEDTVKEAGFSSYTSEPRVKYFRNVNRHILSPLFNPFQHLLYKAKMRGDDWRAISEPPVPVVPRDTSANWKAAVSGYIPLFEIFKRYRGDIVTGDTGISSQFAADPWQCIDMVTYMGGSIPLAIGAYLSGYSDVWAITGDFWFISAGPLGLLEASLRNIPLKTMILDNGKASTTGGQEIAAGTLDLVLKPYMGSVHRAGLTDSASLEQEIRGMKEANCLSILVVDCSGK